MILVNTSYTNGVLVRETMKSDGLELDTIPGDLDFGRMILSQMIREKQDFVAESTNVSEIYTDRIGAGIEIITPRVTTENLAVNHIESASGEGIVVKLSEGEALAVMNSEEEEVMSFDSLGNATFAGTVTADRFEAPRYD